MPTWLKTFGWFVVATIVAAWLGALVTELGWLTNTKGQVNSIAAWLATFFQSRLVVAGASLVIGVAGGVYASKLLDDEPKYTGVNEDAGHRLAELSEAIYDDLRQQSYNDVKLLSRIDIMNSTLLKLKLPTVDPRAGENHFYLLMNAQYFRALAPYVETGHIDRARTQAGPIATLANHMDDRERANFPHLDGKGVSVCGDQVGLYGSVTRAGY